MSALARQGFSSRFKRVRQWQLFMRYWHVVDATFQDGQMLADQASRLLTGHNKLIWHPETDCGDHVVVVNCHDVAMHGFDWKHYLFTFDRRYPRSRRDLEAFQIHNYDPCRVLWMLTSKRINELMPRCNRLVMPRLHLFPDSDMPEFIRRNIDNQLAQPQTVPKKSTEYTEEERARFPRLRRYPDDHIVDWQAPVEPRHCNEGHYIEERLLKVPHM